jgi:hypothetical protein
MHRARRSVLFAFAALWPIPTALAVPASAVTAAAGPQTCGSGSPTTTTGALPDGATYLIQCPATWNGTLFLYSHGYVVPGSPNPAADAGDPVTANWLLQHGDALAGSSYASTGWAVQSALVDQMTTLNTFDHDFGRPSQTIAWGHSLGGMVTAGLVQEHPSAFAGALPFCGVLAGGVATWNTALDSGVAFKTLFSPSGLLQVVNIGNGPADLALAESLLSAAQATPQGRARIALVAGLADIPGWFLPGSPEPASTNYAAQEQNQFLWLSAVDFPFAFSYRAMLEGQAHGNFSWDSGVNFASQLARSSDRSEVDALYQTAGLDLTADLATVQQAPQIHANPLAVQYLKQNISYSGQIDVPVLTVHTTGDGLVIPENEEAYAYAVTGTGNQQRLRQLFVARAGHCSFTPAETIVAIQDLLGRVTTGHWNDTLLQPAELNASAAALGTAYNILGTGPTPAAFTTFEPGPYPRPSFLHSFPFGAGSESPSS